MDRLDASRKANATMTTMTIDQAKAHLEDLLVKAENGEKVTITREDGSAYTIVPIQAAPPKKRGLIGSMQGKIWMADDFDEIPEGFEPYLPDLPEPDKEG